MESPLKGKVLIASPELLDPNFAKAVVLIVHHDEKGAMGLIINRALRTTVEEVWTQVSSVPYPNEDPLYQGGPCDGPLMVLHKDAGRGEMEVCDGVWLTFDSDAVKGLVDESAEPLKFFVGHAGWGAAQLESELAEGAWQLAQIDSALVMATPQGVWEELQNAARKAMRQRLRPAVDPRFIPDDPKMN